VFITIALINIGFLKYKNGIACFFEQTYRHQDGEKVVSFKVDSVVKGNRESFESVSGPHEIASLKLIENAESGDTHAVYSVLKSGLVDPNVSDNQGNCALVEAGLKCHHDVVNTLLDYGANVNQVEKSTR